MKRILKKGLDSEHVRHMKRSTEQILWLFTLAWLTILTITYFMR